MVHCTTLYSIQLAYLSVVEQAMPKYLKIVNKVEPEVTIVGNKIECKTCSQIAEFYLDFNILN